MEETNEDTKEDDFLVKKINRGSTLRAIQELGRRKELMDDTIDGILSC